MFQQPNSIKTVLELKSHKQISDQLKDSQSTQQNLTINQAQSSPQNNTQQNQQQQQNEDKFRKTNSNNFEDIMANNIQNPVSIVFQMKNLLKNVNEKISDLQDWKKKENEEFNQKMKENEEKKQYIRDQLLAEFENMNLGGEEVEGQIFQKQDQKDLFKYEEKISKLQNQKDDDDLLLKNFDENAQKVNEGIETTNEKLIQLKNNYENIVIENQLINQKNFKEYEQKLKDDLQLSEFNAQIQDWEDILEDITYKQQSNQNINSLQQSKQKLNNNANVQSKDLLNIQKEIENENQEINKKIYNDLDDIDKELEELEKLMNYK